MSQRTGRLLQEVKLPPEALGDNSALEKMTKAHLGNKKRNLPLRNVVMCLEMNLNSSLGSKKEQRRQLWTKVEGLSNWMGM